MGDDVTRNCSICIPLCYDNIIHNHNLIHAWGHCDYNHALISGSVFLTGGCFIVGDWGHYVSDCAEESASSYEVQFMDMNSCNISVNVTTSSLLRLSTDECLVNMNCYNQYRARLRAWLNSSWSHYSSWTTMSSNYTGTIIRGNYIQYNILKALSINSVDNIIL